MSNMQLSNLTDYLTDSNKTPHTIHPIVKRVFITLYSCDLVMSIQVGGSLRKKTNLWIQSDVDMILFADPNLNMESVKLALKSQLKISEINKMEEHFLAFRFELLWFDVMKINANNLVKSPIPDPLESIFECGLNGKNLEINQEELRTLFDSYSLVKNDYPTKKKGEMIVKAQLLFVCQEMDKYPILQPLIRLLKFWGLYILREGVFKAKSYIFELIAIHCVQTFEGDSLDEYFVHCLKMLNNNIKIIFLENLRKCADFLGQDLDLLKSLKSPVIVDPVNRFKTFGTDVTDDVPWDKLNSFANATIQKMNGSNYELKDLFRPFVDKKIVVGNVEFIVLAMHTEFSTTYMIPHHNVPPPSDKIMPIYDKCILDFIMLKVIDCILASLTMFEVHYSQISM